MTRGDIYLANLPQTLNSSVQGGYRPVLILQNDIGNRHAPTVIVAPITTQHKRILNSVKASMPTHIPLANNSFVAHEGKYYWTLWRSVILFEQIMTVDKSTLGKRIAKTDVLPDMEAAIMVALGMEG